MKLTVILRNEEPLWYCNEPPTHRSVQVELTPEQWERIKPRKTGFQQGKDTFEEISMAFIEPQEDD